MTFRFQLGCAAAWAAAANVCAAAAPDPLDAKAPAAAPVHRSAFDGYRRLDDVKPVPWRQANDTVERIGGWRSYAREASQSAPAAASPASAPPRAGSGTAPPSGHGGHKH